MGRDRHINPISPIKAAYLAGLIDADGSITLTRRHRNENRQLAISISNTDAEMLNQVKSIVGKGRIVGKRVYKKRHSQSWEYRLENRQALELAEMIAPHLLTYKAKRARLVLADYKCLTPRNGHYSPQLTRKRDQFVNKFLAIGPSHR